MLRTTVERGLTRGVNRASVVPAAARLAGPVLLVLALAAAFGTHLAARGIAVVHQCADLPGMWGVAGMRLALVHAAPDCPSGTALGGEPAAMVTVLGALALPVLVAHAAAAVVAWGMSARARRAHARARDLSAGAARVLRAVVARVLGGLRGHDGPVARPLASRLPRPDVLPDPLRHLADAVVRTRRGPPVVVPA
ncbi:hypothetical protein [Cellulosimicrobium sp. NPDC057127]|uniref:hypothetical protein n=1 Tax=Cellulosimicrobium sp. NPDC057127 TaxID=3346026 RepID=UPI003629824D